MTFCCHRWPLGLCGRGKHLGFWCLSWFLWRLSSSSPPCSIWCTKRVATALLWPQLRYSWVAFGLHFFSRFLSWNCDVKSPAAVRYILRTLRFGFFAWPCSPEVFRRGATRWEGTTVHRWREVPLYLHFLIWEKNTKQSLPRHVWFQWRSYWKHNVSDYANLRIMFRPSNVLTGCHNQQSSTIITNKTPNKRDPASLSLICWELPKWVSDLLQWFQAGEQFRALTPVAVGCCPHLSASIRHGVSRTGMHARFLEVKTFWEFRGCSEKSWFWIQVSCRYVRFWSYLMCSFRHGRIMEIGFTFICAVYAWRTLWSWPPAWQVKIQRNSGPQCSVDRSRHSHRAWCPASAVGKGVMPTLARWCWLRGRGIQCEVRSSDVLGQKSGTKWEPFLLDIFGQGAP